MTALAFQAPDPALSPGLEERPQLQEERPAACCSSGRDEDKRRISELEAQLAELDTYTSSVTHDLKSPLRAVRGFAGILEEDHGEELTTGARDCVTRILRGAREMEGVIDNLLALARIGALPPSVSLVNSSELVERTLADLLPPPAERVRVTVGELRACTGNAGLLGQVWANLLSNALKFTRGRDPALIEIGSFETDRFVTYFVRDNGAGFDMAHARDLFLPFRRFHDPSQYEGHGIGLAIVRRIIQCHGGRVWAESQPGNGARFCFTLPATA